MNTKCRRKLLTVFFLLYMVLRQLKTYFLFTAINAIEIHSNTTPPIISIDPFNQKPHHTTLLFDVGSLTISQAFQTVCAHYAFNPRVQVLRVIQTYNLQRKKESLPAKAFRRSRAWQEKSGKKSCQKG